MSDNVAKSPGQTAKRLGLIVVTQHAQALLILNTEAPLELDCQNLHFSHRIKSMLQTCFFFSLNKFSQPEEHSMDFFSQYEEG